MQNILFVSQPASGLFSVRRCFYSTYAISMLPTF